MPVGAAFYAWDIGVKRGNIQVLGAASYAAPLLSTLVLIAAGFAEPTLRILAACLLITGGAVLAAKSHAVRPQGCAQLRRTTPALSQLLGLARLPAGLGQLELRKSKPGATVQPTSVQSPRLRAVCHQPAGTTACGRSPREVDARARRRPSPAASSKMREFERRAGIEVPDLGGVLDPVPGRDVAALEQEIDRRRMAAPAAPSRLSRNVSAYQPPSGWRFMPERRDDRGRRVMRRHQKLSLRLRISANTSASRRLLHAEIPADRRIVPAQERIGREFLGRSSSAASACRRRAASRSSAARSFSAELVGSTVSAKRALACVYSWPQ